MIEKHDIKVWLHGFASAIILALLLAGIFL